MAGLYIHIPFCTQKCSYCNFFSVAGTSLKNSFVDALIMEISSRRDELTSEPIDTLYFGGGTPSILSVQEVERILDSILKSYPITNTPEITFEANPDDLSHPYLRGLRDIHINRLSIGVQSFDDRILKQIHRRHTGLEAILAIENAQEIGFHNLSVDLIYGIPNQDDKQWLKNLELVTNHQIPHLSCYALTVEEDTILDRWISKGKASRPSEEECIRQFELLMDFAEKKNYLQYEISNFCLKDHESKHNSNYWNNTHYLGFGPGAHSYLGTSRKWNLSNVSQYIEKIKNAEDVSDTEQLSVTDRYNEYIMTALRTNAGIDMDLLSHTFNDKLLDEFKCQLLEVDPSYYLSTDSKITLTRKGKLLTDYITRTLFVME